MIFLSGNQIPHDLTSKYSNRGIKSPFIEFFLKADLVLYPMRDMLNFIKESLKGNGFNVLGTVPHLQF